MQRVECSVILLCEQELLPLLDFRFSKLNSLKLHRSQYLHYFLEIFKIYLTTGIAVYPILPVLRHSQTPILHDYEEASHSYSSCWIEVRKLIVLAARESLSAYSSPAAHSHHVAYAATALVLQALPILVSIASLTTPYSSLSSLPHAS